MVNRIFIIALVVLTIGCKKSKNGNGDNNTPPVPIPPEATTLVSPADNAICYSGTVQSDSVSKVSFVWSPAMHADGYTLYWTNLQTGSTSHQDVGDTHTDVSLKRNTPYSWTVQSNSNSTKSTATSSKWKFYNAGKGVTSYAPFPAVLVSPSFAATLPSSTTSVMLQWTGSSVTANAILKYDLYFGTNNNPPLKTSGLTSESVSGISVSSGTTYYWKVDTKDGTGNASMSQIFQFTIN